MSWLCSRALVEAYSEGSCLDGEQSAPSSGNPTQLAYLPPDKMTKFSRLSRFGMTFRPLTEDRGEELLTLYLADFHAKKSPLPKICGNEKKGLTENNQDCGQKWPVSFAKYNQHTHSLKTHQHLLFADSTELCLTLPQWGTMLDGECWELPMSAHHIVEKGAGLWPTPTKSVYKGSGPSLIRKDGKMRGDRLDYAVERNSDGSSTGGKLNPTWVEWLMGWPIGWTDLKPLEMDKFLFVQHQHGES